MNTFITDLLKAVTPENFPMFVAIFFLVKTSLSLDKLTKAITINCNDVSKVFTKLDDILVYLEYGIVRKGLFDRVTKRDRVTIRENQNDENTTKEPVLPIISAGLK
jgi:DNA-binding transcriptional regulator GbsR (MarR family)